MILLPKKKILNTLKRLQKKHEHVDNNIIEEITDEKYEEVDITQKEKKTVTNAHFSLAHSLLISL